MTYSVPSSEIAINYNNTNYVVTLTSATSSFHVKSIDGTPITVDANTAAHLFGAQQAVTLLGRLYVNAQVGQIKNDWANVLQSDAQILKLVTYNNLISTASGVALGSILTDHFDPLAAASSFYSATAGLPISSIDLALTAVQVHDAINLLNKATGEYNLIQSSLLANRNTPISYNDIKNAIDHTLISLFVGDTASRAAGKIPTVSDTIWDDARTYIGNFAGAFASAASSVETLFSSTQVATISRVSDTTDLINLSTDALGDSLAQRDFLSTLASISNADTARYAPLTNTGLLQTAAALNGNASVNSSSHISVFSISPNPSTFNENAGTVIFTITRSDASQQAAVYVSTVHDQGTDNQNNNYYYSGFQNTQITFAPNVATAQVQLSINDRGLTSGTESFRLIVQQNANDPLTTSLASDTFTIVNNDPLPASSYSITPTAPSLTGKSGIVTFTITRTNFAQAASVYVSTVHDQGTDNPNGNYYYNGILNKKVNFAAGAAAATVQLTINDVGLTSGTERFRLIVQQHSTDPISTTLASDIFTIVNNDAGIIANASINEPTNTNFLLQPFLSLPPPPAGTSISLVNFINTHTGPGQLTSGGTPTSGNVAVAYANVGQVGFSTGSVAGSDKIQMYVTYSNGTVSNTVDLTVNIQASATPIPQPQDSGGPVVNSNIQPLQVVVGHTGTLSSSNLSASDSAYPDPSQLTYTITQIPTQGVILNNGQLARSFTQADINAGHVVYQTSPQPGLSSELVDSFTYIVSDPSFRQSSAITASLKVEPAPPPPAGSQPYVDINFFPAVMEGGQIFVTGNRFAVQDLHVTDPNPNIPSVYTGSSRDSIIVYTIVQGPTHGKLVWFTNTPTLWIPGQPSYFGQQVTQFTQNDLNDGWFVYQNNFTSGAADSFSFTVSDGFGGTIGLTTANIPVQPVNPLHLDINAGVFVTPGGQSIISPDWLRAEDAAPNAYPDGFVVYKIVQAPVHGSLLVSGQAASTFTQLDIGRGLVTYRQDGSPTTADHFTLAVVSDAYGNTISNLDVPVTIAITALDRNTGGTVGIGQSLTIAGANLHVAAPGLGSGNPNADSPSSLVYNITAMPLHGALTVNGTTLHLGDQFTQEQLDKGLLIYTEDGSSAASDSFGFSISDIFVHNNFGSSTFSITIANTNGGQIFSGGSTADIFYSGPGNNWVHGGSDTTLSYELAPVEIAVNLDNGTASNGYGGVDTLTSIHTVIGSWFNDTLIGGLANDVFTGGRGNDTIDGGPGLDTAVFSGLRSAYSITHVGNSVQVSGPDGLDTLNHIERLAFDDISVPLGSIRHDFDANFHSDILWHNDNGAASIWDNGQIGGAHIIAAAGAVPASWHIAGKGDFDADGLSDILWRNDNGAASIWDTGAIGNAHIISAAGVVPNSWHISGTGDFDGNAHDDILWRNDNGAVSIWDDGQIGNAHIISAAGVVPDSWHIAGTGDFDGNGHDDILWRNDNGAASIWDDGAIANAHSISAAGVVPNSWHISGTGDFDNNGHDDILWHNDNGAVSIWDDGQIGGAHIVSAAGVVANSWHISDTGDFDGNGHSDILWRNDNGAASIWDDGAIGGAHVIANAGVVPGDWHIV